MLTRRRCSSGRATPTKSPTLCASFVLSASERFSLLDEDGDLVAISDSLEPGLYEVRRGAPENGGDGDRRRQEQARSFASSAAASASFLSTASTTSAAARLPSDAKGAGDSGATSSSGFRRGSGNRGYPPPSNPYHQHDAGMNGAGVGSGTHRRRIRRAGAVKAMPAHLLVVVTVRPNMKVAAGPRTAPPRPQSGTDAPTRCSVRIWRAGPFGQRRIRTMTASSTNTCSNSSSSAT